ncbi:MAG: HEAT repeat domain-containing protein [Planctomycetaceae bacterium]|nr:HEAT repeat domain-containing protein [Planctomycetaceae bacterium]
MPNFLSLRSPRPLRFILPAILLCGQVHAQRDLKDIPPPDPELERKTFVLPEGFEVNLFAADPQIAKPIQMNFDPQGRLWIVSSHTYPQILPGDEANDRVLILEDADGDGVSDSTTVFAEGLLIPTGIEPGDGGAYVAASTEVLHLKDTDGDGKADSRRIVLSGFGTEDTHHILHTFRWGPAQRLFMKQSIYIHSHVETPWGVQRLNAGGTWRFDPQTWRMSVFDRGLVNSWGIAFDDYGTTFATDGAGGEGINYIVPGASYLTAYGAPRILHGLNPGSPKHCGLEIVNGRHLPDDWQGSLLTNDFRGHRVCRFVVSEDGSGYYSQEQQEVIKSDHVAFRPIDIKMGSDGAIYIADWYNPIIQHGEVDFRDPRRDHTHGRIWRVTYKGNPLVDRPKLVDMTNDELAAQLAAPERWTRKQAMRLLKERGPDVLTAVKKWVRNLDNSAPGYHQRRLEALRVYQAHDVVEPELLESLLTAYDHNARAAATRIVGDWHLRLDDPLALLAPRATDEHPRVRLEAVRVLAEIQDPRAIEIAMTALDPEVPPLSAFMTPEERQINKPGEAPVEVDQWLDYALWLTCRDLQPVWQPALLAGEIDFDGNTRHLTYVLKSAGSAETVGVLTQLLSEGAVPDDQRTDVLEVITEHGGPNELGELLEMTASLDDAGSQANVLESLLRAHRRRQMVPAGDHAPLEGFLASDKAGLRGLAMRCVGTWHVERLWPQVKATVENQQASAAERDAAIQAVAAYSGDEAIELLRRLAGDSGGIDLRLRAIRSLMPLDTDAAVREAVAVMQQSEDAGRLSPLFADVLNQKPAIERLATALNEQDIPADVAVVALRAVRSSGQQLPELTSALQKAGGVTSGPKELSPEEMESMIDQVLAAGDPAAGEAIYRRAELNCVKCHAIGGAGGKVGPDLVSLGATAQLDYLINALLDPNKQVKENYHTQVVVTDEGQTFSGILVRASDSDVLLRDAEGREISVPLDSIEDRAQGVSLMPAGLTDKLTQAEIVNLVAFLKALGRLPEFTVSSTPTVKHWEVLQPSKESAFRLRRVGDHLAAQGDPAFQWVSTYGRVDGSLPLGDLPTLQIGGRQVSFVRVKVFSDRDATMARLSISQTDGLTGWWNGEPLTLDAEVSVSLHSGENWLTLAVSSEARANDLRITLDTTRPEVRFAP